MIKAHRAAVDRRAGPLDWSAAGIGNHGGSWLAKALAGHGIQIIATDNGSWDSSHGGAAAVFDVRRFEAVEAVQTFGDQADVFSGWIGPAVLRDCG